MNEKKFTRISAVTLPTLSHKKVDTYYLKVVAPMYKGKQMPPRDGKPAEPPADCLRVINLETGEEGEYLTSTIAKERLMEMNDYVGKCFEFTKLGRRDGKRYDDYAIYEISDPYGDAVGGFRITK